MDGRNARMFDGGSDTADDKAFAERCKDDRHHFRFIVSPEDAAEMTDLKAFARDLVAEMERDLGTQARLDRRRSLEYRQSARSPAGARQSRRRQRSRHQPRLYQQGHPRACRATRQPLELGPKSEREVQSALERDVAAERWTESRFRDPPPSGRRRASSISGPPAGDDA